MKKYEAPSIEFYVFETPESIMGSQECNSYDVPDICILDTPSCTYDFSAL